MDKPVYLGLSVPELSKISFGTFGMMKPSWKTKNCVIWIQNFIVYIKTDDIYEDIAEDVETRSGTWNWELDEPLPNGKKVI